MFVRGALDRREGLLALEVVRLVDDDQVPARGLGLADLLAVLGSRQSSSRLVTTRAKRAHGRDVRHSSRRLRA